MKFLKIIDFISKWSGIIFSFLAAVVVGVIIYEVIARHVFGAPTIWAHELMTLLSGALFIMGGAYTLWVRGHVNVDVLYQRLSTRGRAITDLLTFPFFLFFCSVLLWTSAEWAWGSWLLRATTATAWAPPIYPLKFAIALGTLLIILQGVAKFIRDIYIVATGKEP